MAQNIDFNALKARTMGSGNDEEAVTVDTRGLISKVLSRYSGKWTVLREMIQNAADASATRVTIKFETLPSATVPVPSPADPTTLIKHVISNHTLKCLLISNNGLPFSEKDWARLKRIADGNPDETKIGAFGVGFYSVFDDCEEPFVSSGGDAMAFYWKGNALFTRRLRLAEADFNPETTFVLDYRNNSSPVPSLMELCQFLAISLTFVGLETIDLWLDDWNLLKLTKKTAPSVNITLPRDVETKTPEGLMKVLGVKREVAQVDATWMRAVDFNPRATSSFRFDGLRDTTGSLRTFFSRFTGSSSRSDTEKSAKVEKTDKPDDTQDLTKTSTASVFLHINTASIQASISQTLSSELERATRKPPPKKTTIAILTPSYDANIASEASQSSPSEILSSILPSKSGRVFIGFPTHQTTGLNAHISAPSVIPTVERESIDLNTRYISKWNLEMLRAAGIVCRIAWSAEMESIKARISPNGEPSRRSKIREADILGVLPEAIHTANQFVFRESTPSAQLGQTIEDSFWMCNKNASIDVLSTCGVIPSHQVRLAPKELSFMDSIPVLPDDLVLKAKEFINKLVDYGLVIEITVSDIKRELEASALTSKQLGEFLAWVGRKASRGDLDPPTVKALLGVAVTNDEDADGTPSRLIVLADINSYLNPSRIPADLPLPPYVMPFKYTKTLEKQDLEALGWVELQIVPWIRWLIENAGNRNVLPVEQDMTHAPSFSAQVLPVLSKQWDGLSQSSKQTLVNLLQPQTVIPTKAGMKRPTEAYFSSVRLFDDLPIVHGLNSVKEKFLAALGVRKTVELGVIFERLLDTAESVDVNGNAKKKWSHVDLIKYLASVRDDIPAKDIERLKSTKICTAEGSDGRIRYKISELFEPKDSLKNLGLPVIEWPGRYQPTSIEGKFLTTLGLKKHPSASELVELMAKAASEDNSALQGKAMSYYLVEYHTNGYASFDTSKVVTPYLPIEGSKQLSTPGNCFTNDGAASFGFNILRKDLHPHASKFGVKEHPPLVDCIEVLLRRPPVTQKEARTIFGYLAGRVGELPRSGVNVDRVGHAKIVPVATGEMSEKTPLVRHVAPKLCYLGQSEDYGDIFDFVDFGDQANMFLIALGSKQEPTKVELGRMLVKEPAKISSRFQSPDKYLRLLRSLAENISVLKRDRELFNEMRKAPFLLASRELPSQSQAKTKKEHSTESDEDSYEDEDQGIKEWQLTTAKDAVIVDDYQSFSLFKEHILAAPQEETLEKLYLALGTPYLSSIVEEQAQWGATASDQRPALKLQKLINERSRLFLHDQSPDSIRHDTKWLEKHLSVQVVQSISLRRSLKGRRASHTQKRSAIITQQPKGYMLWICPGKYNLYEISQALVHLILLRPKLHSTLTLEMLLKTDLLELRARGYNVERILKQKAHEARMAEDRRQKQLEEERRQLQEREARWVEAQEQQAEGRKTMPGLFPDSPSNTKTSHERQPEDLDDNRDSGPRGLFSNLTRRLGFNEDGQAKNRIQSFFQGQSSLNDTLGPQRDANPPPPYSAEDPGKQKPGEPKAVTSPHALQANLLSAIQSCRPHGSSGVYSRPETNQVTETKSYCDERPGQDLEFAATLASGINFLIVRSVGDRSAFLAENSAGINTFSSILIDCASVFAVRVDSISIFYDPGGKTIAFNQGGSLFCNYLYFKQLHQQKLLSDPTNGRADALVYWWVILCHELAHNLVADHSSDHSYYTEGFVAQYFPRVAQKLAGSVPA
ncbi:hypothetical protein VTN02DRAFT_6640 [Thermoascus thermophilus]